MIVARLIDGWEALDAEAIAACLAERAVWHNMPYAPIVGRTAIAAAIARFLHDMVGVEFRVRHQAEISASVVLNERIDVFRRRDGTTLTIPVMGCFEIEDGLVVAWRDYFDSSATAA